MKGLGFRVLGLRARSGGFDKGVTGFYGDYRALQWCLSGLGFRLWVSGLRLRETKTYPLESLCRVVD